MAGSSGNRWRAVRHNLGAQRVGNAPPCTSGKTRDTAEWRNASAQPFGATSRNQP
jgi:hypothetical protein